MQTSRAVQIVFNAPPRQILDMKSRTTRPLCQSFTFIASQPRSFARLRKGEKRTYALTKIRPKVESGNVEAPPRSRRAYFFAGARGAAGDAMAYAFQTFRMIAPRKMRVALTLRLNTANVVLSRECKIFKYHCCFGIFIFARWLRREAGSGMHPTISFHRTEMKCRRRVKHGQVAGRDRYRRCVVELEMTV